MKKLQKEKELVCPAKDGGACFAGNLDPSCDQCKKAWAEKNKKK